MSDYGYRAPGYRAPPSTSPAGWFWPVNSRKAHFFAPGEHTSMCGKWLVFTTTREQGGDNSPDNCVTCKKRAMKAGYIGGGNAT